MIGGQALSGRGLGRHVLVAAMVIVLLAVAGCGGAKSSSKAAAPKAKPCTAVLGTEPGSHLALCLSGALSGLVTANETSSNCRKGTRGRSIQFSPKYEGDSIQFSIDFTYTSPHQADVTSATGDFFIAVLKGASASDKVGGLWNQNNIKGSGGSVNFTSDKAGSIDATLQPDFFGGSPSPGANTKALTIKGSWSCSE